MAADCDHHWAVHQILADGADKAFRDLFLLILTILLWLNFFLFHLLFPEILSLISVLSILILVWLSRSSVVFSVDIHLCKLFFHFILLSFLSFFLPSWLSVFHSLFSFFIFCPISSVSFIIVYKVTLHLRRGLISVLSVSTRSPLLITSLIV